MHQGDSKQWLKEVQGSSLDLVLAARGMPKFYCVMYTKKAAGKKRKNKSFADGLLAVDNASYTVYDEAGNAVAREMMRGGVELSEGAEVHFESWDVEIDQELSEKDFRQRREAIKATAEGHTKCTENSGRTQLHNLDRGSQAHASRLEDAFYAVIYTARAPGKTRKHKSFKDGVLRLCSNRSLLYDEEGKVIAERAGRISAYLPQESEVAIGRWDAELGEELTADVFRAGDCFQKSGETLLLERLHASRSARADAGQGQTALPRSSITRDTPSSIKRDTPSSMGASGSSGNGDKEPPAAVHVRSDGNGCLGSKDKLIPKSIPQLLQQQQSGTQTHKDPTQASSGSSAQVHRDSGSLQPSAAVLLQRVEGAVGTGKTQKREGVPISIGFLDDVSCLEVE